MARVNGIEFSELERLAKKFKKAIDERVVERIISEMLLELAYRAERKIKKRTPVDTGDLRRNWRVGRVQRQGNRYVVEIINIKEYASFVEYGHRTRDGGRWVDGRFMATISMQEIERELPRHIEKYQMKLLQQIMNGRL